MAVFKIERVIVTGGREFSDYARIHEDLRDLHDRGCRRVAEGRCHKGGADLLAQEAWRRITDEETIGYPVERAKDGPWPAAGNRRNVRMLREEMRLGRVDLVLAYPDPKSRGTWACVADALCLALPVMLWAPGMEPTKIITTVRERWAGASFLMTEPRQAVRCHRLLVPQAGDQERAAQRLGDLVDSLTWWPV